MSKLDQNEFEQEYIDQQEEIIPALNVSGENNKWSREVGFIAWGLLLTSAQINHLYLQFILPTIGVLLLFSGTRSLRGENKRFHTAYILSILFVIFNFRNLILSATPFLNTDTDDAVAGVYFLFELALLRTLRHALNDAFNKYGYEAQRDPLAWATVWIIIVFALAIFVHSISAVFLLPLLFWDFMIYVSLNRFGPELDKMGCCSEEPPAKVSTKVVSCAYIVVLAAVVGICCIHYNHLPQDAEIYIGPKQSDIGEHLIEMGLPSEILNDLTDKDISVLKDCVNIQAGAQDMKFNTAASEPSMTGTTVYFQLSEKELYILHYFKWLSGKPYWQDGISIMADRADADLRLADSALLYENNKVTYKAAFPSLNYGNVTTSNVVFGAQQSNQFTGTVSYPFNSQCQRGYVLYHLTLNSNQGETCSAMSYMHMQTPFNMPYSSAEEKMLINDLPNRLRPQTYTFYELKASP